METLGVKYGTKSTKESKEDCEVEVNCIFHDTILRIGRSNCFDIINSFWSIGTLTN